MSEQSLLSRTLNAAERNSTLAGADLRRAAKTLVNIATMRQLAVIAADDAGERILGAALALKPDLQLVDRTRRTDGLSVLVVAGWVAGPYDVVMTALLMRKTGADHVHAVVMAADPVEFEGCESVVRAHRPWRPDLVA